VEFLVALWHAGRSVGFTLRVLAAPTAEQIGSSTLHRRHDGYCRDVLALNAGLEPRQSSRSGRSLTSASRTNSLAVNRFIAFGWVVRDPIAKRRSSNPDPEKNVQTHLEVYGDLQMMTRHTAAEAGADQHECHHNAGSERRRMATNRCPPSPRCGRHLPIHLLLHLLARSIRQGSGAAVSQHRLSDVPW